MGISRSIVSALVAALVSGCAGSCPRTCVPCDSHAATSPLPTVTPVLGQGSSIDLLPGLPYGPIPGAKEPLQHFVSCRVWVTPDAGLAKAVPEGTLEPGGGRRILSAAAADSTATALTNWPGAQPLMMPKLLTVDGQVATMWVGEGAGSARSPAEQRLLSVPGDSGLVLEASISALPASSRSHLHLTGAWRPVSDAKGPSRPALTLAADETLDTLDDLLAFSAPRVESDGTKTRLVVLLHVQRLEPKPPASP